MKEVAVLFAHRESHYKNFDCCDVYDIDRDARTFTGNLQIIAHPPCRAWGKYSYISKHTAEEKELSVWALEQVKRNGGILEHPNGSQLFKYTGTKAKSNNHFLLKIDQSWFGHLAKKSTLLFFSGFDLSDVLPLELSFDLVQYSIDSPKNNSLKNLPKRLREITPPKLCNWLVNNCLIINKKSLC